MNNRKEGKGAFIWSDGTKYSGNWMSDKVCVPLIFLFRYSLLTDYFSVMVKVYLMLQMNLINMLGTGQMIINMVKGYLLTTLVNMKENGLMIRFVAFIFRIFFIKLIYFSASWCW